MIAYMRNVRTGEIKGVQLDSDEFDELKEEVYDKGDGRGYPAWEQTGKHFVNRVESGDVNRTDLGDDFTPVEDVTARGPVIGPDPHPERTLTAAEVEAGITDHQSKLDDLGISVPGAELMEEGKAKVGRSDDEKSDSSKGGPTKAELRDQARDLGITGTSSMNKQELQEAIDYAEGEGDGDDDDRDSL
jgi:hypothetical protein